MVRVKRTASEWDHRCITDRTSRQSGSKRWVLRPYSPQSCTTCTGKRVRWPRGAEPLSTCFTLSKWKALDEALNMICIILQIIGKPNVIIVLLFIQNNWYYKSCLPRSMSSSRLYLYVPQQFQEYKGLFNVGYSTNSSSHPLISIFNVFPMFWGRNSIVSSSQSVWKFFANLPKQLS